MFGAGHLSGGAPVLKRYKIGATIANAGVPIISNGTTFAGVVPATTTNLDFTHGLSVDTGTYSTTQGDAEGLVTVSVRPDLIVRALMSGGATEGTALTLLSNTSASAGGTTVTDADVSANDMTGGTVMCTAGNNVGLSRMIVTHTGSTSLVVTVPFPRAIAVGDEFFMIPYALMGDGTVTTDGNSNLQTSTLFTQADASIASGSGGQVSVVDLELNGRSDSYVLFVLDAHVHSAASAL